MSRSTRSKGPWRIVWQSDAHAAPCASTGTRTQKTKRRKRLLSEDRSAEILKVAPRRGGAAPPQPNHLPHELACPKVTPLGHKERIQRSSVVQSRPRLRLNTCSAVMSGQTIRRSVGEC